MNKKYPTFFPTWFNKNSQVPYPGVDKHQFGKATKKHQTT